ncbi:MAG: 2-C-methyl-D-erythritol 4-phosphate cytidylyltransferase [Candidatus Neomarinimicrobiota bacterium]
MGRDRLIADSDRNGPVSAIIPAAGRGLRFGGSVPKQFLTLGNTPLLFHTIKPFLALPEIGEIIIVVPEKQIVELDSLLQPIDLERKIRLIAGGERRQDSVQNGLAAVAPECELVVIHDAGRPFVTEKMIRDCIAARGNNAGAIMALPASDTVKRVVPGSRVIAETIPRETIWLAQTPQVFRKSILLEALVAAEREGISGTDEAALVERLGYQVVIVNGSPRNFKITTPDDWETARRIWEAEND